ncbi:MAG: hypothetical protein LC104_01995 [Bacteroidales bacterium]|nr:hypothetical protein [Bacteroidales bacterium]
MESDAKLGLLAGVAAVLVVAVVYFHKPVSPAQSDSVYEAAAITGSAAAPPTVPPAAVLVPVR